MQQPLIQLLNSNRYHGRFSEYFGFKVSSDGNIEMLVRFFTSIVTNRLPFMDLILCVIITCKHPIHDQKLQPAKSASSNKISVASSTSKESEKVI